MAMLRTMLAGLACIVVHFHHVAELSELLIETLTDSVDNLDPAVDFRGAESAIVLRTSGIESPPWESV